jgi:hypothetical protein
MADQGRLVSAAGERSVQNGRGIQQQDDAHNGYFCAAQLIGKLTIEHSKYSAICAKSNHLITGCS